MRLRKALAGDLSLLKELRAQTAGDLVDAALDSAQDEISSQLAEVESRELANVENALERMRRAVRCLRRLQLQDSDGPTERLAVCHVLHHLPARNRKVRRGRQSGQRLGPNHRFRRRRIGSHARRYRDRRFLIGSVVRLKANYWEDEPS